MDTDAPSSSGGIYAIRHVLSRKVYVGQVGGTGGRCFSRRCKEHFANATMARLQHKNSKFGRAVRKYGPNAFEFIVLEVLDAGAENAAYDAAELQWMTQLGSLGEGGYNVHAGTTPRGVKRSEETRKRMSEARKKMLSDNPDIAESLRRHLSDQNKSDEARARTIRLNSSPDAIAKRSIGIREVFSDPVRREAIRIKTAETNEVNGFREAASRRMKERMSNPAVRNRYAKPVVCLDTGIEYASINAAARTIGVTKVAVQRQIIGKAQTCKGLKFKFKEAS